MTFCILGHCTDSGQTGIGYTTVTLAGGGTSPFYSYSGDIVVVQAYGNIATAMHGARTLDAGGSTADALAAMIEVDPAIEYRQIGILTRDDGQIYRTACGRDPWVISETCAEVTNCRKAGILINTFMLARDYDLVSFVKQVTAICHGKAYFTSPHTLGRYVLMDYLDKKTRTVH